MVMNTDRVKIEHNFVQEIINLFGAENVKAEQFRDLYIISSKYFDSIDLNLSNRNLIEILRQAIK